MSSEKFIQNNLALTTLVCACVVVLMSLSVRQVFGMFFIDFNNDLGISNTEFGLAIGIQMLGWGLSGPIFGVLADKYGGHKSIILAFLFYILGVYFLYAGPNTGIYFQISLGVLIGIGCGGTGRSRRSHPRPSPPGRPQRIPGTSSSRRGSRRPSPCPPCADRCRRVPWR